MRLALATLALVFLALSNWVDVRDPEPPTMFGRAGIAFCLWLVGLCLGAAVVFCR